jgi:hypothetical protein
MVMTWRMSLGPKRKDGRRQCKCIGVDLPATKPVGNAAMGERTENMRLSLEQVAREITLAERGNMATLSLLSRLKTQPTLAFLLTFGEKLEQHTNSVFSRYGGTGLPVCWPCTQSHCMQTHL